MGTDFDAIVVGGGFAGVTAARELEARGRRTLLLEARDRLGGRTWTDSFAGTRVEMGGTWVHWFQPHVWSEITRYDIPLVEDAAPERCILASGDGLGSFELEPVVERLDELCQRFFEGSAEFLARPYELLSAGEAVRELDALSLSDRFDQLEFGAQDRAWLDGFFSVLAGSPTTQGAFTWFARWWALSGWSFPLLWDILSRYRFAGGTASVLQTIVEDSQADVRLDTAVASVVEEDGEVRVTTRDGDTFAAPTAVLAVPVNVWPTIDFKPGLGDVRARAAARGIGVPHGAKVWVHARGDIGRVFAQLPEDSPLAVISTYTEVDDGQLLVCFSGNPSFDIADHGQVEAAVKHVLPEAEVLDVRGHDWVTDEFSLGGWAFLGPGRLGESLHALQEPQGRLVFAGSDLANGWSGFIDGAIESGLRAGRQAVAVGSAGEAQAALLNR